MALWTVDLTLNLKSTRHVPWGLRQLVIGFCAMPADVISEGSVIVDLLYAMHPNVLESCEPILTECRDHTRRVITAL